MNVRFVRLDEQEDDEEQQQEIDDNEAESEVEQEQEQEEEEEAEENVASAQEEEEEEETDSRGKISIRESSTACELSGSNNQPFVSSVDAVDPTNPLEEDFAEAGE